MVFQLKQHMMSLEAVFCKHWRLYFPPELGYHSNITVTGTNFIAESTYCEIGNVIIQAVSVASTTQIICNVVQTKRGNYSTSVAISKIMDYIIHILVLILQIYFYQN